MKKTLLLFFVSVLATLACMAGTTVTSHTVTFDFSTVEGLNALGITVPASGKTTTLATTGYTLGDVTMTSQNSNNNRNYVMNHSSYG